MNLHCNKRGCSHNTGFEYSCMYGISADLIRHAKNGNSMCEHLRQQILELEKMFCKAMTDRIVERLEERTEYFKDCTKYGNETEEQEERSYSIMMMYEVADLVDDLIEIVKEEGEI